MSYTHQIHKNGVLKGFAIAFLVVIFGLLVTTVFAYAFTNDWSDNANIEALDAEAGDLNNDGKMDYVVLDDDKVYTYVSGGAGSFTKNTIDYAFTGTPVSLALLDYNSNGNLDLAVGTTSRACVAAGAGTGMFGALSCYNTTGTLSDIVATDINNDHRLDVAYVASNTTVGNFVENVGGTGNFQITSFSGASLPIGIGITSADFMQRGRSSIFIITSTGWKLVEPTGESSDIELTQTDSGSVVKTPRSVLAVNTNGDTAVDIAIGADEGTIYYLAGSTSGGFACNNSCSPTSDTVGGTNSTIKGLTQGDINNDGYPDIMAAVEDCTTTSNAGAYPFIHNGSNGYADETPFGTSEQPVMAMVGDSDNDADLDTFIAKRACNSTGNLARHYANDQAATSANTSPAVATSLSSQFLSSNLSNRATLALKAIPGSDTQTPTAWMRTVFRLKAPSGSPIYYVFGTFAGPYFYQPVIPSTSNNRIVNISVDCSTSSDTTYTFNARSLDTGFKLSPWTASASVVVTAAKCASGTADPDDSSSSSSSSSSSAAGGGGLAYFVPQLRRDTGHITGGSAEQDSTGKITGTIFFDANADAKRSRGESGIAGVDVSLMRLHTTVEQTTSSKSSSSSSAKPIEDIVAKTTTAKDGTFAFPPAKVTAQNEKYFVSVDNESAGMEVFTLVSPAKTEPFALLKDKTVNLLFTAKRREVFGYAPCLFINALPQTAAVDGTDSEHFLSTLSDRYGNALYAPKSTAKLVTREQYITLLMKVLCTQQYNTITDITAALRSNKAAKENTLTDMPLKGGLSATAKLFYAALADGVEVARKTSKGTFAAASEFITREDAVSMTAQALHLTKDTWQTDAAKLFGKNVELITLLPGDVSQKDDIAPFFAALRIRKVLPASFLKKFNGKQGVTKQEMEIIAARSALVSGKVPLVDPIGTPTDTITTPQFIEDIPTLTAGTCLSRPEPLREKSFVFSNLRPGHTLFTKMRLMVSLASNEQSTGKPIWFIPGTVGRKVAEYGIRSGYTPVDLTASPSVTEIYRNLQVLFCKPWEAPQGTLFQMLFGRIFGAGTPDGSRDVIAGLARDTSKNARILWGAQTKTQTGDQSLLTYLDIFNGSSYRSVTDAVSVLDASKIFASALLYNSVNTNTMTKLDAQDLYQQLQTDILKFLTQGDVTWRNQGVGGGQALTYAQMIDVLGAITQTMYKDEPVISLGQQWLERLMMQTEDVGARL